jgi:hypothetical protein
MLPKKRGVRRPKVASAEVSLRPRGGVATPNQQSHLVALPTPASRCCGSGNFTTDESVAALPQSPIWAPKHPTPEGLALTRPHAATRRCRFTSAAPKRLSHPRFAGTATAFALAALGALLRVRWASHTERHVDCLRSVRDHQAEKRWDLRLFSRSTFFTWRAPPKGRPSRCVDCPT